MRTSIIALFVLSLAVPLFAQTEGVKYRNAVINIEGRPNLGCIKIILNGNQDNPFLFCSGTHQYTDLAVVDNNTESYVALREGKNLYKIKGLPNGEISRCAFFACLKIKNATASMDFDVDRPELVSSDLDEATWLLLEVPTDIANGAFPIKGKTRPANGAELSGKVK